MKDSDLQSFHRRLMRWYKNHGRNDLPWRKTRDPYRIWLSEVMLQQTQVKTVKERYWQPFLKQFPTIEALAAAPREQVLKAWEGMGYYNRAANLHKAAQALVKEARYARRKARLPDSVEALMALPGIGKNTAHAVAALAFNVPAPVMEANVKRVLCRIFALKTPADKVLWEKAHALMGEAEPFDYNQAMMDIGALVCTPKAPDCKHCPAESICAGSKTPESYPQPKKKAAVPVRKRVVIVLTDGKRYLVGKREGAFLSGLYGFPESAHKSVSLMIGNMAYLLTKKNLLGRVRQVYSHFILEADVHRVIISVARADTVLGTWKTIAQLERLPTSKADQKIIDLLRRS